MPKTKGNGEALGGLKGDWARTATPLGRRRGRDADAR